MGRAAAHLSVKRELVGRLHVAVITMRGETMHVISLRKANRKQKTRYEKTQL
jgi:uncharacterized DUF497 family protein